MSNPAWIPCSETLPGDGQRVLAWLPSNTVHLPGKTCATEERNIVILRFAKDFFLHNPSKTGKATSPHFWVGVGSSNHFFEEVSHWMPLPSTP
jgi:hypothetical protein